MNTPRINIRESWSRARHSSVLVSSLIGFVIGGLGWLLSLLVQRAVVTPLLCRSADDFTACAQGGTYAWWFAMVLLAVAGLFLMVNRGVYRPLLVVLAAFATVWSLWAWLGYYEWWQAAIWQALIFVFAYGLFTLVARIPNFAASLGVMIVVIVAVRALSMLA